MVSGKRNVKRVAVGCGSLLLLLILLLFVTPAGRALRDIWGTGAIQDQLSGKEMLEYNATTEGNLRAIHTALLMYHESEGQFPDSAGWVDAIYNRILVDNMTGKEAEKKLISPSLIGKEGHYGYAMNDAASGKYKDDVDPKMPLIFDSRDTARNAHGTPEKLLPTPDRDGQNMGISVDGTILKL